jgi:regulator of protease activity HflC (stomatin/prohibitin superfamily)
MSNTANIGLGSLLLVGVICGGLYGCPQYEVYSSTLSGQAELAKAESTRRTKVLEAQAVADSAGKLAEAEVTRAEGVAKANKIIGDSLKGNEAYLRYLWVDKLDGSKGQVIYVPTEAGMPLLEAGRGVTK